MIVERYTYSEGEKWRLRVGDTEYSGSWVDRLAAYEDTGLEPEEVAAIAKAKAEGQIAVFPCKEGDEIYVIEPADCCDGSCPDCGTEICRYNRFRAPDEDVLACQNRHRCVECEEVESIAVNEDGNFCINGCLVVRADEMFRTPAKAEAALLGGDKP